VDRHRRRTIEGLLVVLAACATAFALASCAGLPNPPGDDKVTIQDLKFIPSELTVNKGSTVTWTNNDQTVHTITSDDFPAQGSTETPPPGSFTSQPLNPGDSYSHRFDKAGSVGYHCSIHMYLKGTIVVR
jgi:plastocyanin